MGLQEPARSGKIRAIFLSGEVNPDHSLDFFPLPTDPDCEDIASALTPAEFKPVCGRDLLAEIQTPRFIDSGAEP